METAGQQQLPDWMKQLIGNDGQEVERTVLVDALNSITTKATEGAWEEIDTALKNAPVATLSSTALMTLLRGTFRFQVKLAAWEGFRDAVAEEFERRGLNVSRLLMGLLPATKAS
jgi:S-adenosylmethionine:diacylglycerol 3-amino-3-carboxypropyl transferase